MRRVTAFCLLAAAATGCGSQQPGQPQDARILVVASILPLADFAREVGGDKVAVESMVPPGASPHTYELVPSQLLAVSKARLLVLNGIGLEFWADQVISAAANPDLVVVRTSEGFPVLSGDPDEPGGNPHIWLSPRGAMHQVRMIRDGLIRCDPEGSPDYQANAAAYLKALEDLDEEIHREVGGFANRQFVSFHAAWAYFARNYGLEEAAVIERRPGQEPSPDEIASIVKTARSIRARAVFAEPQFSPRAAETIAEEAGAQVLFLNPLGSPPDYRYLDMMRANLKEIGRALR